MKEGSMRRNQMITIKQRKTLFCVMLSLASITLLTKAGWAQHIQGAKEKAIAIDSSLRSLSMDKAEVTPVTERERLLLERLGKLEQRLTDLESLVVKLSSVNEALLSLSKKEVSEEKA